MKRPKKGDLVYVEMDDIEHGSEGWQTYADIGKVRPLTYRAVGWVVRATKRTLTLSSVASSRPSGFCHYLIPWGSLTRIRKL